MKTILVTGSAGFIGANLVKRLFTEMTEGTIIGVDNVNSYYDPSLKEYAAGDRKGRAGGHPLPVRARQHGSTSSP